MNFTEPKPDNNMVWAIVCTATCCLPLGIVSLVYSQKVDTFYFAERYDEAREAAENAKKYAIIGMVCGLVFGVLYLIGCVILAFMGYL